MTADDPTPQAAYLAAGVDTDEVDRGLTNLVDRIRRNWLPPGEFGGVQLPIGYFANVVNIGGGKGLAICTDGVGTKAIIAQMMGKYDTIGIDCIAMNVNDLVCLGAKPLTFVDYVAVDHANSQMLEAIGIGLARGAEEAGVSISGGETAQLEDVVRGFDLAGTAVGLVSLDRILTGRDLAPGDLVVGIASSGMHSNGFSLARKAFFKRRDPLSLNVTVPGTDVSLGDELLRPTLIYVRAALEVLQQAQSVKALIHITGDGLLNLARVESERVGFVIDDLPRPPAIFKMVQQYYPVSTAEMFEVYNMGIGFCMVVDKSDVDLVLSIAEKHDLRSSVIGKVIDDPNKRVYLPQYRLVGHKKHFHQQ
ncbi:MAG TPA: phosphoribosylformylglycinamidine cyclo-ligase [Stellaceae bacterium]|jgi:phosphoribosylformylglycinamidine cyclo-ligase